MGMSHAHPITTMQSKLPQIPLPLLWDKIKRDDFARWHVGWDNFKRPNKLSRKLVETYLKIAPTPAVLTKIETVHPSRNLLPESEGLEILRRYAMVEDLNKTLTY